MGGLWRERFDFKDEQAEDESTGGSMESRFMKDPPGQGEGLCVCVITAYTSICTRENLCLLAFVCVCAYARAIEGESVRLYR